MRSFRIFINGIMLDAMLILAFSPLDWKFPVWLWIMAIAEPVLGGLAIKRGSNE